MSYPYWEISVRILFSSLKFIYDTKSNLLPKKTAWTYSPLYNHIYAITLCYFLNYLVPLSMLVYIIVKLSISLRELNKKCQEMSKKVKQRNDLTFSLVIVVLVFILCQLSNPLRRLLYVIYGPYHIGCGTVYFYFGSVSVMLVNFNSACNFFIFCLCSLGYLVKPVGVSSTMSNGDRNSTINEKISKCHRLSTHYNDTI